MDRRSASRARPRFVGSSCWVQALSFAPTPTRTDRSIVCTTSSLKAPSLAVFAFCGNYFGTRYFYGSARHALRLSHPLDAQRRARVSVPAHGGLLHDVLRTARRGTAGGGVVRRRNLVRGGVRSALALVAVSLALACLETALNANGAMKSTFCYGNLRFALWFGTLMYGTHFVIAGPCWHGIDEARGDCTPLRRVLTGVLAASMLILGTDEIFARAMAPHFTTVVHGRVGIPGKQGPSCLVPPAEPAAIRVQPI